MLRDSLLGRIASFVARSKTTKFPADTSHFNTSSNGEDADIEQGINDKQISNRVKENESTGTACGWPTSLVDGNMIVGLNGEDDQENPQIWSNTKRYWVGVLLW